MTAVEAKQWCLLHRTGADGCSDVVYDRFGNSHWVEGPSLALACEGKGVRPFYSCNEPYTTLGPRKESKTMKCYRPGCDNELEVGKFTQYQGDGVSHATILLCEQCDSEMLRREDSQISFAEWFIKKPSVCNECGQRELMFMDAFGLTRCRLCHEKWMNSIKPTKKPPLGVLSRHLHDEKRFDELVAAMARYRADGKKLPSEWIGELVGLAKFFGYGIEAKFGPLT